MWSLAEAELTTGPGPVLLIPAHAGNLEAYTAALAQAGLEPVVSSSRRAALSQLREVDLAVVEIHGEDTEGWEICRTVRARFPELPLVVVSPHDGGETVGRSLALGAIDHVNLPVPPRALAARIRNGIGRSRAHLECRRAAERFSRYVRVAPVPLFILQEGRIRLGNQQMSELTGIPGEELVGRPLHELLLPNDQLPLERALRRWEEGGANKLRLPVHVPRPGRRPRDAELTLVRARVDDRATLVGTLREKPRRRGTSRPSGLDEGYFRSLIEGAHDIIMVVDRDGTIRYTSPSSQRVMSFMPAELEGQQILTFVHPDDTEQARDLFEKLVAGHGPIRTSRARLRNGCGDWRVLEFTVRDLLDDPDVNGIVVNARDVTDQQAAETALRESEARFRLLVEGSRDVFFYVRRRSGELVYLSPSVAAVLGVAADALVGRPAPWAGATRPNQRSDAEPPSSASHLALVQHSNGEAVTLEFVESRTTMAGLGEVVQGFARDVSERERMQEAVRNAAFQDSLTGLPNRSLFTDRVRHAISRMKRHPDQPFALLFLDLDRFKVINDSLGHGVGDSLLVAVSNRLKLHLRPEDTLARFGGDEFAILLEDASGPADAPRVAHRIAEVLAKPFDLNGYEVFTSASIGIVVASPAMNSPESLLQCADMAMYRAKAAGGNAFELYDQPMHAQAVRRLQLEGQLRRAVDRGELCLNYQPIIRLSDGATVGAEALLRWNHPIYGVIAPVDFIGLAEESGFISEIGEWTLAAACEDLALWQRTHARPDLFVTVNLSARQLRDSAVLGRIQSVLRANHLAPTGLKVEITEHVLAHSHDRAIRTLRELMNSGVQIFLDDFGAGNTSLGHLLSLPLSGLKIDPSFVARMNHDPRYGILVESSMNIAKGLGLCVVAEGVEEIAQANALIGLACDFAQGYHFSPPVTPDAMGERLAAQPLARLQLPPT